MLLKTKQSSTDQKGEYVKLHYRANSFKRTKIRVLILIKEAVVFMHRMYYEHHVLPTLL